MELSESRKYLQGLNLTDEQIIKIEAATTMFINMAFDMAQRKWNEEQKNKKQCPTIVPETPSTPTPAK